MMKRYMLLNPTYKIEQHTDTTTKEATNENANRMHDNYEDYGESK
jgi:hypothetical protein